jgi:hypothetical protein
MSEATMRAEENKVEGDPLGGIGSNWRSCGPGCGLHDRC